MVAWFDNDFGTKLNSELDDYRFDSTSRFFSSQIALLWRVDSFAAG